MKNPIILFLISVFFLSNCSEKNKEDSCPKVDISVYVTNSYVQVAPLNSNYGFFEAEYGANGFSKGSGTTTNNLDLGNLPNGTYDVYLRGNCGGNDWSSWTGPKSFIVQGSGGGGSASCKKPEVQSSSQGSTCKYFIYFNDGNYPDNANYFQVEYGLSGFPQGTGTLDQTNSTAYVDGSFMANKTYDFYVRANCGGSDWSDWSDVYSFYISKNFQMCEAPTSLNAYRNGGTVQWEIDGNGECEYEISLSTCSTAPCNGDNIYPTSNTSGSFSASSGVTWYFFARSICKDGSKTPWSVVQVTN